MIATRLARTARPDAWPTRRATTGEVAVVAVDQRDCGAEYRGLDQRVRDVAERQELHEVVLVGATRLIVDDADNGAGYEETGDEREKESGDDRDHRAHQAGTTTKGMGRRPMASTASISSAMRIAPISAVMRQPACEAKAMPATSGAISRTLARPPTIPDSAPKPIRFSVE